MFLNDLDLKRHIIVFVLTRNNLQTAIPYTLNDTSNSSSWFCLLIRLLSVLLDGNPYFYVVRISQIFFISEKINITHAYGISSKMENEQQHTVRSFPTM